MNQSSGTRYDRLGPMRVPSVRSFKLLLGATVVSQLGDWSARLALAVLVLQKTGSRNRSRDHRSFVRSPLARRRPMARCQGRQDEPAQPAGRLRRSARRPLRRHGVEHPNSSTDGVGARRRDLGSGVRGKHIGADCRRGLRGRLSGCDRRIDRVKAGRTSRRCRPRRAAGSSLRSIGSAAGKRRLVRSECAPSDNDLGNEFEGNGEFCLAKSESSRRILAKRSGVAHCILGNGRPVARWHRSGDSGTRVRCRSYEAQHVGNRTLGSHGPSGPPPGDLAFRQLR